MTQDLYVRWPFGLSRCVPRQDYAHHGGTTCYRRVYVLPDGRKSFEPDGSGLPVSRELLCDSIALVRLDPPALTWEI